MVVLWWVNQRQPFGLGEDWSLRNKKVIRESVKYYFADFVRNGGEGVPPKSVTPFSMKFFFRKRGGGGTPQIRNLVFGPKSGVF